MFEGIDYDFNGFDTTFSKKNLIDFLKLSLTAVFTFCFSRMNFYCTMTQFHCLFMEELMRRFPDFSRYLIAFMILKTIVFQILKKNTF